MNQTSIKELWNTAKKPGQIETGTYAGRMTEAKLIVTKSGHDMMVIEFILTSGDFKNQKLSKFYGFDERGIGYLKQDLASMEKEIAAPESLEALVQSMYELCPLDLELYVQTKADKTGQTRTNVYINGPAKADMMADDDFTF
jgi:hypothetical protein